MRAQIRQDMNVWEELQRFCEKQWELIPKAEKFRFGPDEKEVIGKDTVLKFMI